MSNVRIKDLATDSALQAGDYVIVDSETEGTRKYDIGSGLAGKVNKPSGNGVSGQVLKTNGDGTTQWANESGGGSGVSPYTSDPAELGTASPGISNNYARGDHVHPMPSAGDVGAAPEVTEVTVSSAGAVSRALDAGKIYHFTGAITALTITLNTASNGVIPQYHFDFISGATAPTLTLPNSVKMPDGFTVEANKRFEIDILNGYGVAQSWAVS